VSAQDTVWHCKAQAYVLVSSEACLCRLRTLHDPALRNLVSYAASHNCVTRSRARMSVCAVSALRQDSVRHQDVCLCRLRTTADVAEPEHRACSIYRSCWTLHGTALRKQVCLCLTENGLCWLSTPLDCFIWSPCASSACIWSECLLVAIQNHAGRGLQCVLGLGTRCRPAKWGAPHMKSHHTGPVQPQCTSTGKMAGIEPAGASCAPSHQASSFLSLWHLVMRQGTRESPFSTPQSYSIATQDSTIWH
jgi:hypothetical protein